MSNRFLAGTVLGLTIGTLLGQPAAWANDRIVEIRGTAEIRRRGDSQYRPVSVGAVLRHGDLLRPARSSQVRILCSNNSLTSASSLTSLGSLCPDSVAARFGTRSRGEDDFLQFLSGRFQYATQVIAPDPVLRWNPIANASRYRVELWSADQRLWQQTVADVQIRYEGPPLQPGMSYTVLVFPIGDRASDDPFQLDLRRLDAEAADAIAQSTAQLEAQELETEAKAIALADLYQSVAQPNTPAPASSGLVLESLPPLEAAIAQPDAVPYVHRLLGDLYLQVGLFDLAEEQYQLTIQQAEQPGNNTHRSAAMVGLANVAAVRGDRSQIEYWLRLAKVEYALQGDSSRQETVQEWLDKLAL